MVRRALAGVRRTRKTAPKRRSPLLLADVRVLLAELTDQFCVWAAAMAAHRDPALMVMGFTGALRRSELVNPQMRDWHPGTDIASVKLRCTASVVTATRMWPSRDLGMWKYQQRSSHPDAAQPAAGRFKDR